jgi:tRNA threonylcarbamoyladenosine biosynthesis protein TsaE
MMLRSPEETRALGRRLGLLLRAGDFIALVGELGAGKTLLVRGVAEGAGVTDAPSSPTFALANLYRGGRVPVQHLDLYRLAGPADLFALGFEDLLAAPVATLCEWADRAGPALPQERLEIRLEPAGVEARRATFTPRGARARELLDQLLEGGPAQP